MMHQVDLRYPVAPGWANAPSMPLTYLGRLLETAFVFLVLMLSTGAFAVLRFDRARESAEADVVFLALWVVAYALAAVFALAHWKQIATAFWADKFLVLLLVWVAVSLLWSAEVGLTLRRGGALFATTLIGMHLGARFSLLQQLRLVTWLCLTLMVVTLGFVLFLPEVTALVDGWRGIFINKNTMGRVMVLGAAAFLCHRHGARNLLFWGGFGLASLLVLQSRSVGAVIVLAALLAFYPLLRSLRFPAGFRVVALLLFILLGTGAATWVASNSDYVLRYLGKEETLTGRTKLWQEVAFSISREPWLGYGYGAFWRGPTGESGRIWASVRWPAPSAHNGALDVLLDLGPGGLLLLGGSFILAVIAALRIIRRIPGMEGLWPLLFLTFLFLYNITESTILRQNSIFWILYVSTVVAMARQLGGGAVRRKSAPAAVYIAATRMYSECTPHNPAREK